MQHFVEHEIVLPSQKVDCHPIFADLENDQISIRNEDKGENKVIAQLDLSLFDALKPIHSKYKKTINGNTNTSSKSTKNCCSE